MFLANLLNKSKNISFYHETLKLDFIAYVQAFNNPKTAMEYISGFRKKYIYYLAANAGSGKLGEVNSVLRRHAEGIQTYIPGARVIHVIRDGRDVVRSMMARETFTWKDPVSFFISPSDEDPYYSRWSELNRFEKLCWYWYVENEYLAEQIDHIVRFEDALQDFDYFSKRILSPLNLDLSYEVWKRHVKQPKNVTENHRIPHWKEWDSIRKNQFHEICGDSMSKFGY